MNLFVYGSLMSDTVWQAVTGTLRPAIPATARGWEVRAIRNASYPGLVPATPDAIAHGLLRTGVSMDDLRQLDKFEGSFYERIAIRTTIPDGTSPPADAWVVAPSQRHHVLPLPWDAHRFFTEQIGDFLRQFCPPSPSD
ncbi:MAG: gamma-glutamylcyclotransferase family protein [Verrucomicrobiota bacterium]